MKESIKYQITSSTKSSTKSNAATGNLTDQKNLETFNTRKIVQTAVAILILLLLVVRSVYYNDLQDVKRKFDSFMRNDLVDEKEEERGHFFEETSTPLVQVTEKTVREDNKESDHSSANLWLSCYRQIQNQQIDTLKPILTNPDLQNKGILLIDPAYHANVGDTLLAYGEVQFLKKFGYGQTQIYECNIQQSLRASENCNDFSNFKDKVTLI